MSRWLARLALPAALATGVLFAAGPAWANSTVNINSGNVPTTAAATAHECSANQGGGPYSDTDVWVFVLPGNQATSGDFVSLTAQFDTDGNGTADTTLVIPTDGGGFLNGGPAASKAYLPTPAGWTLETASAVITGKADFFTLSHTCPASGSTPSPTPPGTPSPSPTTPGGGSSSGSSSSSTPSSSTPGTTTPPDGGKLPTTGIAIGGFVLVGVAMIATGVVLLLARRRENRSTVL